MSQDIRRAALLAVVPVGVNAAFLAAFAADADGALERQCRALVAVAAVSLAAGLLSGAMRAGDGSRAAFAGGLSIAAPSAGVAAFLGTLGAAMAGPNLGPLYLLGMAAAAVYVGGMGLVLLGIVRMLTDLRMRTVGAALAAQSAIVALLAARGSAAVDALVALAAAAAVAISPLLPGRTGK